ncbi:hypothetical protein FRC03_004030, partial [Tulasnella sp. 419]
MSRPAATDHNASQSTPRSSTLPFPNQPHATTNTAGNPKADQIVHRFFNKVVLVILNARIPAPDVTDPLEEALLGIDEDGRRTGALSPSGTDTPSRSTTGIPATSSAAVNRHHERGVAPDTPGAGRVPRPKIDKWFNIETPDSDIHKNTLALYRAISTAYSVSSSNPSIFAPKLSIQIFLSIPHTSTNQVLVLTHTSHRTRIDPTPRHILLESWTVDLSRASSGSSISTSSTASTSVSSTSSSISEVELPTVYKQAIALFRSLYTLLRILPAWKLHRRLRKRTRTGLGGGMALEMRVEAVDAQGNVIASSPAVDSNEDSHGRVLGFDTPLSQDPSANSTDTHSFPSIPTPLGFLAVSVTFRTQVDFSLDSLESLLSSGFASADRSIDGYSNYQISGSSTNLPQLELYSLPPDPPPNYPRPLYPPVTEEGDTGRVRPKTRPPPLGSPPTREQQQQVAQEVDAEFEVVGPFTPTVVVERRRKESETPSHGGALGLGRISSSQGAQGTTGRISSSPSSTSQPYTTSITQRAVSATGTYNYQPPVSSRLSPRSQPASLPRAGGTELARLGTSSGSEREPLSAVVSSTPYGTPPSQSQLPPRTRFNSIPHSSSPLTGSPLAASVSRRQSQQSFTSSQGPLTPSMPMHSRTISMPGGPGGNTGGGTSPGRFAFARTTEELPFASSKSGGGVNASTASQGGVLIGGGVTVRRRVDSHQGYQPSGGLFGSANGSTGFSGSPRSNVVPLPATRTPPTGPVPLPSTSSTNVPIGRPSLHSIHPFKSATVSSSPSSYGASGGFAAGSLRGQSSPLSEHRPASALGPGVGSPRSPVFARQQTAQIPTGGGEPILGQSPEGAKRFSAGSSVVGGLPGSSGSGTGGGGPTIKRYSSSFGYRYNNNNATTTGAVSTSLGSDSAPTGGVPGSLGSGRSIPVSGGSGLGLAGVNSDGAPRKETTFPVTSNDDDDISGFLRAIDARPPLRGGSTSRTSPGSG